MPGPTTTKFDHTQPTGDTSKIGGGNNALNSSTGGELNTARSAMSVGSTEFSFHTYSDFGDEEANDEATERETSGGTLVHCFWFQTADFRRPIRAYGPAVHCELHNCRP